MSARPLRIATRGSELALAQARAIAARLERELGRASELVVVTTSGDRIADRSLAAIGGKGLFVKELEEALLGGRADLAVHSAKDLPARTPPGLALVAFPERADPRDALVARVRGHRLATLPAGARVGTGSVRRAAQLMARRPDLVIVPLRGNVPTRLRKLESEGLDAVVLACAGLERLGLAGRIDERIPTDVLLPAVAQGTLALETRADDPVARELARLDDPHAARSAAAERAFLLRLEGDCNLPLAAYAGEGPGGVLVVRGLVASPDGGTIVRGEARGTDARAVGVAAAEQVIACGGADVLVRVRGGAA